MPTLKEYIDIAKGSKEQLKDIYEAIEGEVNEDATLANLATISLYTRFSGLGDKLHFNENGGKHYGKIVAGYLK